MKAGILEEMVEDTLEGLEGEEEEDAAQEEIDKILLELTAGALGAAPDALKGNQGVGSREDLRGAKGVQRGRWRAGGSGRRGGGSNRSRGREKST